MSDIVHASCRDLRLLRRLLLENGWNVVVFKGGDSKGSFFDAARSLPSDPPMGPYPNWDGLADSLSGGLIAADTPPVAIIWEDAHRLRDADPEAFAVALSVLHQVADVQEQERANGRTTNRVRFFVLGSGFRFESGIDPAQTAL